MSPSAGPPSDWVSGERVFAPPSGTFDVDWLVGAVLEAAPGSTPAEARAALLRAWRGIEAATDPAAQTPAGRVSGSVAEQVAESADAGPEPEGALALAARRVAEEARRSFRA